MTDRVLFVGECNPYGNPADFDLYCMPPTSAGGRLQRLVCGLHQATYLALPRANLCRGDWNLREARETARRLVADFAGVPIVLLGRKVTDAFGREAMGLFSTWCADTIGHESGGNIYVRLPHPSDWHAPGAFQRARVILRAAAPGVPWGELDGGAPRKDER
jgi:hypothetical protein